MSRQRRHSLFPQWRGVWVPAKEQNSAQDHKKMQLKGVHILKRTNLYVKIQTLWKKQTQTLAHWDDNDANLFFSSQNVCISL